MTPSSDLRERARRLLLAETQLFGSSAERARLLRPSGVLASLNPHAPDRSIFNWVVFDERASLLRAYDELAQAYAAAGVRAWTVWVDDGDHETERELTARGHKLDGKPRVMAAELASMTLPPVGDLQWRETDDIGAVAAINDAAYGFPPPAFGAALVRRVDPRWHAFLAFRDDHAVGCALTYESEDGDCGVSAVATLAEARGTGTASRLLAAALTEARARGAVTTTLQATSKGAPIYLRLGYRDLGPMQMWEHRVPAR